MRDKKNSLFSAVKFSRKIALCFVLVYSSLLSLTFLSYQDEILPPVVESEFVIGDEDIDHSPHLQIIRYCQFKLRSGSKPLYGWVLNENACRSKISYKILAHKNFLSHHTFQKPVGSSVLFSVFRI